MLLQVLSNFGRKASLIGRQQHGGGDGASELAYFLLTGCSGAVVSMSSGDSQRAQAATSGALLQMRLALRDAAGTIPVAVCTSPEAADATNASMALQLQRAAEAHLRRLDEVGSMPRPDHVVVVERIGAVGDHVAFRHPAVAMQWLQRLWSMAGGPQDADDDRSPCRIGAVHMVLHVTMAHVPHHLIEGPLLQLLLAVDASYVAHRAHAAVAQKVADTPRLPPVYASVVVEVSTPLMASLVQEKAQQCLRVASSPRIVLSPLCVHDGATNSTRPDSWLLPSKPMPPAAAQRRQPPLRQRTRSFFAMPRHLPLATFLHDVVLYYRCVLDDSAMELLKASWCAAHDMTDVVQTLHQAVFAPFRYTLVKQQHHHPTRAMAAANAKDTSTALQQNAAALCDAMWWLSRDAASTFELEVRCFASLLECVASGLYDDAAAVMDGVRAEGGIDGRAVPTAEGGALRAKHEGMLRAACSRTMALPWASTDRYWAAVGVAALEQTSTCTLSEAARRTQKRPRSETVELMAPVVAVPCISVRDVLLAAALTRVRHVEESLGEVEVLLRAPSGPTAVPQTGCRTKGSSDVVALDTPADAALSLNFFHSCVPFSLRVLCVLTHVGVGAKSQKGRWVALERLAELCCRGDTLQLLHAVRQLRVGKLIAVNGATQEVRSLLAAS